MQSYHDVRKSGSLSYARKLGAHLPSFDLSYSKENDYLARSAGLADAWTLAHGRMLRGLLLFASICGPFLMVPLVRPLARRLARSIDGDIVSRIEGSAPADHVARVQEAVELHIR